MKSILITGGSGFFGRHFIKRLLSKNEYDRICVYSRDEAKQANMRLEIQDPDERLRYFIGDVRDKDRLTRAFHGIDVVVHGAALKRIEVGAYNPDEMVKTNIGGSVNVIQAAIDAKVKKVVYLSTDKAFQPISPYGHSKALAESLFLAVNNTVGPNGPKFSVTRYGNVIGSTGSVVPTWRKIINNEARHAGTHGKAVDFIVPITNPACTRFWMTIDEAIYLVKNTITLMPEVPAIPCLPGFKLSDLAEAMGLEYIITGLGKYEKLHECMAEGNCSNTARRMSVEEIREALKNV